MCASRIVVRIEIATLCNQDGKFNHRKMDKLARVLSNLNNSGKQLLVVSSGAIALGTDKLGLAVQPQTPIEMQAAAAIGQAELIKFYQNYFDQYNQQVAQVLLTADVMCSEKRVMNTRNTFDTLLSMNIIPLINENDSVSTSDIELDDNYPLALNVAKITNADIILIKTDLNSNYIIQPKGEQSAILVSNEHELFEQLELVCSKNLEKSGITAHFPKTIADIVIEN